jgi:hypothetical protein
MLSFVVLGVAALTNTIRHYNNLKPGAAQWLDIRLIILRSRVRFESTAATDTEVEKIFKKDKT